MFTNLTDTTKGAVFSALVLVLAVGAATSIDMLGLASATSLRGAPCGRSPRSWRR